MKTKTLPYIIIALMACAVLRARAIIPIDHATVLHENRKIIERTAPADDEEDPYMLLTGEAEKAINEGDYLTAIFRLKDAMRVQPDNPQNVMLLSNLGMVYSYLDQDSLAMKAYNDALSIAPSMTTVLSNRAMLCLKMGRDRDAMADFEAVIERDSLNAGARYYHGMISLYSGDLRTAKRDFDVLLDVDPKGYNTAAAWASLYTMTGQDREAIPHYQRLIDKDPAPEFYAALAGCYLAISDLSSASSTIREGLEKCGDDPDLYYYRAWLNKESFRLDDAKADGKRAIELGADPARVKRLLGN